MSTQRLNGGRVGLLALVLSGFVVIGNPLEEDADCLRLSDVLSSSSRGAPVSAAASVCSLCKAMRATTETRYVVAASQSPSDLLALSAALCRCVNGTVVEHDGALSAVLLEAEMERWTDDRRCMLVPQAEEAVDVVRFLSHVSTRLRLVVFASRLGRHRCDTKKESCVLYALQGAWMSRTPKLPDGADWVWLNLNQPAA